MTNNGKTVYSTDRKEVGEVKSESYPGMRTAMNGAPYSSMTKEEQFHSIKGVLRNIMLLETYIPKIEKRIIAFIEWKSALRFSSEPLKCFPFHYRFQST